TYPHGRLENPCERELASAPGPLRGEGLQGRRAPLGDSHEDAPGGGKTGYRSPAGALPVGVGAGVLSVRARRRGRRDQGTAASASRAGPGRDQMAQGASQSRHGGVRWWPEGSQTLAKGDEDLGPAGETEACLASLASGAAP